MNIFDLFGKKAPNVKGADLPDISQMADQLFKEGKITADQAAKIKDWDSLRPDPKASPDKFESWMKLRPNLLKEDLMGSRPPEAAGRPAEKAEPTSPKGLDIPDINQITDQLAKEGKISQMQAFQLKTWASVMPDKNANPAKWEAWKKAKPDVDIPGF